MSDPTFINLHAFLPQSFANGPGSRAVVWFQGCTLQCAGCFNPASHATKPNRIKPTSQISDEILCLTNIEGITISGGEPFQQPEALCELLKAIKEKSKLTIILLSGYSIDEIREIEVGEQILSFTDVLIAGRYNQKLRKAEGLCGSSNKSLHFFTHKYSLKDFETIPDLEIIIKPSSELIISGIEPLSSL
jgi:anaerobic ribonucleoside-triphosphate reductase activating protein